MPMSPPTLKMDVDAYLGDTDTGVVHRFQARCAAPDGVFFLDMRTALVRGFRLCACCTIHQDPPAR